MLSSSYSSLASACSDPGPDPYGRQGIAVAQPQSGNDYPLVDPSPDIRYLLADFYLSYDDPADYDTNATPFLLPFRINWLYGAGCAGGVIPPDVRINHEADLQIVDAVGQVVFDSTDATSFLSKPWGNRLHIYAWETGLVCCRLVIHTKWSDSNTPPHQEYPTFFEPEDAVLDIRTIYRLPKRVLSITAVLDKLQKTPVTLVGGYNMDIAVPPQPETRGGRLTNDLVFSASPGAGAGLAPGCLTDRAPLVIRTINGVQPTAGGDFFLAATDCYFIRQPTTIVSPSPRRSSPIAATLQFGNDCVPCCSCADYVNLAEALNALGVKYSALGALATATRDSYHEDRARWLASLACFTGHPLRLVVQPQLCPFLDVAAQFCNQTGNCVGPLTLTINMSASGGGVATEVPGYTYITGLSGSAVRRAPVTERYTLGGGWPTFMAYWDALEPYTSVTLRFRLQFGNCGLDGAVPYVAAATLTGTLAGQPIKTATPETATATLVCPAPLTAVLDPTKCFGVMVGASLSSM